MEHTRINLDIDADDIANRVFEHRKLWESRSNDYPFFTLGKSAYLDGKTDAYYKDSEWLNDRLVGGFGDLYEEVLHVLQELLEEPVELAHDVALPGFHIFPSDPKFLSIAGNWHQDYPHHTLGLGDKDPFAFTVAIKLPKSGGGMDYMDEFHQPQYLGYNERDLILHDGLTIHRIAGLKAYVPNEYRITFQGHIIRRDNILEVFW
jgi:hypothetical protein